MLSIDKKIFIVEQWLDKILESMLEHKASDLHIEPYLKGFRLRIRLNGLLQEMITMSSEQAISLINRIKILSHLDISETRLPQDGRLNYEKFSKHYFRISTCSTIQGEKLVLRNLLPMQKPFALDELGMLQDQQKLFENNIQQADGLILVCGPTGSGKTNTLYSALQFINKPEINIITLEDPVEIQLEGINQISIQPKINLNFATSLRSILRQDPDIIMIGEIRDKETAEIAISAAQTGHLVLSTLHANNSIDATTRLKNIGIDPYQFSHSTLLIIAQRLLRTKCQTKRTGVYELLQFDEIIRQHIFEKNSAILLKQHLSSTHWVSMQMHAMQKLEDEIIDQKEIQRVFGDVLFT